MQSNPLPSRHPSINVCRYLSKYGLIKRNGTGTYYIADRPSQIVLVSCSSLGTNSSMFTNCLVFCDVRSSVLGQNVMFGRVRSSDLLLCDQTSLGTYSLIFANCLVFCDVRSLILGQNVMFIKFHVQTFNVWSIQNSVFWCLFQD